VLINVHLLVNELYVLMRNFRLFCHLVRWEKACGL